MASVLLEGRNLLFLHVPKTAGASISRVLRGLPDARSVPVVDMERAIPCVAQLSAQLPRPLHTYRRVAFVRNPWDWTVSGYLHVTANRPAWSAPPTFREFVLGRGTPPERLQYPAKFTTPAAYVDYHTAITPWEHLGLDESVVPLGDIGRFERLQADVDRLLGPGIALPHLNPSTRRPYPSYYDDETRAIVAERNRPLIERFGYQFAG